MVADGLQVVLFTDGRVECYFTENFTASKFMQFKTICILIVWCTQIWTCVYHKNEFDNECVVTRIFNAQCGARDYYGISLFTVINSNLNIYNY